MTATASSDTQIKIVSPWPRLSIAAMRKPNVMALRPALCQSNRCGARLVCGK